MDANLDPVIARQHAAFTRRQARAAGFHRATVTRRIARGTWATVNDHVLRLAAAPVTDRQQVMGVVLSGGPDTVATASTALALRGLRGFRLLPASAVTTGRPPRWALPGVTETYRLAAAQHTVVDGIPTATVARALFDLAAQVRLPRLARAVDAALAARKVTVDELQAVIDDLAEHGRHGSASLRAVIAQRQGSYVPPTTDLESAFLELVRASDLPEPERQVNLGGTLGWIGQVDFLWQAPNVVVETDGGPYHNSLTSRIDDERRDRSLEAAGWIVLRFSDLDVAHRPTSVIRTLSRALAIAAA
jgi:very-short-patch-repair endonuclease